MSGVTDDPSDPALTRGADKEQTGQAEKYLVLSESERAKGFIRPYRDTYIHIPCGTSTTMSRSIAETYARDPHFYGYTYCVGCSMHKPVFEFRWKDTEDQVGS